MISGTRLDAAIEHALQGATVSDDLALFAGFVDDLRVMADRPAPPPSAELAVLLAGHDAPESETCMKVSTLQPRRPHRRSTRPRAAALRGRVEALGFAGKAAMVAGFATSAVAGAAAAGILPEPAIQFIERAIEVVTPFELPATGQGARHEDATEDAAAGKPGHAHPSATDPQPAPTVRDAGATGAPALDGEPTADDTPPSGSSSATATGSTIAPSDAGAQIPDATASPAPQPGDEPSEPAGPEPKDGHIPPGQAPADAPLRSGGSPGDAPRGDPDSAPGLLSAPNGDPHEPASPGGPPSAPDRHGPHHRRQCGPGAAQDPHGQPPSNVPDEPWRPGPSPDGKRGNSPQAPTGQDPAALADDRRAAPHREDPPASGNEAARHADGRPEADTGSPPATGAHGSATPPPSS